MTGFEGWKSDRAVEQRQLARLITWRSQVRILSALLQCELRSKATVRLTEDAEALRLGVFICFANNGKDLASADLASSLCPAPAETRPCGVFRTSIAQLGPKVSES